ncbi:unnamed protein product [Linum tenue]|uniref:Uncharacterized protein n=1 Tax=Linum tenue TaxID=586396 RepID=A0AAV0H8V2_9ROSI|nr:unnamed protein product [Linum tenue]CAI0459592.1 unnamed protein product [Linum tenue]
MIYLFFRFTRFSYSLVSKAKAWPSS